MPAPCHHCKTSPRDPTLPRRWRHVCRECYRAYRREYMARYRGKPRVRVSWRGTPAYRCFSLQRQVAAEARERGVTTEAVIQEWRMRT